MKFSYTKTVESDFSIKNPNLTKNMAVRRGRGWGCG